MGFLDRISESISETGQEIKRKADQSSAKGQMNNELKRKEKELEALVYQIGMTMVSNEPEICREKCGDLYKQLLETREASKTLRDQLALAELQRACPGCGRIVNGAVQFCTFCGSKMPEINLSAMGEYELPNNKTVIRNQSGELCAKCGSPLKVGAAFCVNCGTPVAPPTPPAHTTEPEAAADITPIPEFADTPPIVICQSCGAQIEPGDAFCTNCGTPV